MQFTCFACGEKFNHLVEILQYYYFLSLDVLTKSLNYFDTSKESLFSS